MEIIKLIVWLAGAAIAVYAIVYGLAALFLLPFTGIGVLLLIIGIFLSRGLFA